jgi:outer membrane protein OmpA-like peptidoglycan-associated protein
LGELLKLNSSLKVEVSGHTDNVGDDLSNMLLSQKRADAIKYYLIKKSIQPNKIISTGKGEKEPIRENTTGVGRQENRRVEIMVVE